MRRWRKNRLSIIPLLLLGVALWTMAPGAFFSATTAVANTLSAQDSPAKPTKATPDSRQSKLGQSTLVNSVKEQPSLPPQTLKLRLQRWPESFHPLVSRSGDTEALLSLLHGTLVRYSPLAQPTRAYTPYLAEKWSLSKERTHLTITLKKGLTFSASRTELTARDVIATVALLQDPQRCTQCRSLLSALPASMTAKPSQDGNPFKLTLVFDQAVLLEDALRALSRIAILPHDRSDQAQGAASSSSPGNIRDINGSGPYKISTTQSRFRRHITLTLRPNIAEALGEKLAFPALRWVLLETDELAMKALQKKLIHILTLPPDTPSPQSSLSASDFKTFTHNLPTGYAVTTLLWNTSQPVVSEMGMRRLIAQLLARNGAVKTLASQGLRAPLPGLYKIFGYKDPKLSYPSSGLAQQLRSLGYTQHPTRDHATKITPEGREVKAELSILYSHPRHQPWLAELANKAAPLGIVIQPRFVTFARQINLMESSNYDGAVFTARDLYHSSQLWQNAGLIELTQWSDHPPPRTATRDSSVQRASVKALSEAYVIEPLWYRQRTRHYYWSSHLSPPLWASTAQWQHTLPAPPWLWQPAPQNKKYK